MTHQENGTTKAVYRYTYDTLGRLMGSSQTGSVNLRASYGYDNNSRLKSFTYSIPGVIDSASQTYYIMAMPENPIPTTIPTASC